MRTNNYWAKISNQDPIVQVMIETIRDPCRLVAQTDSIYVLIDMNYLLQEPDNWSISQELR